MRRNIIMGLLIFILLGSNCSAPLPNEDALPLKEDATTTKIVTPTIEKTSTSTIDATAIENEIPFQQQKENLLALSPYYLTIEDVDDLSLKKISDWFEKIGVSTIVDCHNSEICATSGFQYNNGAVYITIYQIGDTEQAEQLLKELFRENLERDFYQYDVEEGIIFPEGKSWSLLDGRGSNDYYRWSISGATQGNFVVVVENMQQYCWCGFVDEHTCISELEDGGYNSLIFLTAQVEKIADILNQ